MNKYKFRVLKEKDELIPYRVWFWKIACDTDGDVCAAFVRRKHAIEFIKARKKLNDF